jgi:hypothetical protein
MAVSFIGGGIQSTWRIPPTTDKLYHIMLCRVHLVLAGFKLTTLVVIGTDGIGSCKSNYHTIVTTTTSRRFGCMTLGSKPVKCRSQPVKLVCNTSL